MKVAIYERSAKADHRSSAIQRWLAGQPNLAVVARFRDAGVSGLTPMAERPDGARLVEAARRRDFDAVAVASVDRLGRDYEDVLSTVGLLHGLGIEVIGGLK